MVSDPIFPRSAWERSVSFNWCLTPISVLRRDLLLTLRRPAELMTTLFFFIIVVSLFPLGIGPQPELLREIAPGVLWVAALLASLLALPRLFAADHADGTLEQLALAPQPLSLIVFAKLVAHWLTTGLPLTLLAPLIALQFDLPASATWVLVGSLALGTPIFGAIGAVGAALTLGLRGGGVLTAVLVLPLYIPALIFGAGAVEATLGGLDAGGHLSLLAALTVFTLTFAPWAAAAAVRISLD
jgi:heme exporter protein B